VIELRPYQREAVNSCLSSIESGINPLVVLPTAAGKTVIFIELIKQHLLRNPKHRVAVVLNKVNLQSQTLLRIEGNFPSSIVGSVCGTKGERDDKKQIVISTVGSYPKDEKFDLIIIDEAHRSIEKEDSQYASFIFNDNSIICGFTATPWRTNSGYIYGDDKLWEKITYKKDIKEMINDGWLCKPTMKCGLEEFDTDNVKVVGGEYAIGELAKVVENKTKIDKQIADALPRLKDRNKIVWACVTIEHANMVCNRLNELNELAVTINSNQTQKEQQDAKREFEEGKARHFVFITIVSEGYDFAPIDSVVFMRPTKSSVLWVQTVGRGLRTSEDKNDCLILDYGRVAENCGSLDKPLVKKGRETVSEKEEFKVCPNCQEIVPISSRKCPDCNHEFMAEKTDPVKNLTSKAKISDLLSEPTKVPEVVREAIPISNKITLAYHKAASGNVCLKVTIYPKDYLRRPIMLFKPIGSKYYNQLVTMLVNAGVGSYSDISSVVNVPNLRKDFPLTGDYVIHTEFKNNFYDLKRIERVTKEEELTW